MSALEDSTLEDTRQRIGALVILTGDSSPRIRSLFLESNTLNGVLDLMERGYVQREEKEEGCCEEHYYYSLTDIGRAYARKTLDSIGKIL